MRCEHWDSETRAELSALRLRRRVRMLLIENVLFGTKETCDVVALIIEGFLRGCQIDRLKP